MSIHIPLQALAHFQLVLEIPSATSPGKEVTFTLQPLPFDHTADVDHTDSLPNLHFKSRETEGGIVIEVTRSGPCNVPTSYSPEPDFSHVDSSLEQETDISQSRIGQWDGGPGPMSEVVIQAELLPPQDTNAIQGYGLPDERRIEALDFAQDALSRASTWSSLSAALSTTHQTESKLSTPETTIPDSDVQEKWVSQPAERVTRRRPRLFPCKVPGCDRFFTSDYTRETHTLSHRPKRKRRYPCSTCDALFTRNHDRYRHEVYQHGRRTQWECERCVQCFPSENSLLRHDCSQAVQLQWKPPKIGGD